MWETLLPASVYSADALLELATKLNISHASYASLPQSKFFNIDLVSLNFAGLFLGGNMSDYEKFTPWFQSTMNKKAKILTDTH